MTRSFFVGDKQMDEQTKEQAVKKFYGHDRLKAKYTPQIPAALEREYKRIINQYMRLLKEEFEKELPNLKQIYRQELADNEESRLYHTDSATGLFIAIEKMFQNISNSLITRVAKYNLHAKLEALAARGQKLSIAEWKKAIKATFGLNLKEDVYSGDVMRQMMQTWTEQNVDLISTIPHDTLGKMKEIIYDGFDKGKPTKDIAREIQMAYGTSKAHAQFIARDQCAKLNGEIQRSQQQSAGVTHYIWSCSKDERVRDCHAELDGKMFDWNNPPEMWYETKAGRVYTGRFCHPGEDYQCRCVGRPVFDASTMNFEVEEQTDEQT